MQDWKLTTKLQGWKLQNSDKRQFKELLLTI